MGGLLSAIQNHIQADRRRLSSLPRGISEIIFVGYMMETVRQNDEMRKLRSLHRLNLDDPGIGTGIGDDRS